MDQAVFELDICEADFDIGRLDMHTILQPEGWAKPVGYANGVAARGQLIFVGGQVGWNGQCQFETDDFVGQVRQTLQNIVAVLAEAGATPQHITSMTWYFTDKAVQLHGGDGVRKGHIVESLYREIRALRIYEGASDVQKVVIARQVMGAA